MELDRRPRAPSLSDTRCLETIGSLHCRLVHILDKPVNLDVKNVKYLKLTSQSAGTKYKIVKVKVEDNWNTLSFGQGESSAIEVYNLVDRFVKSHGRCPVAIEIKSKFSLIKRKPTRRIVHVYEST